VIKFYCV